MKTPALAAGVFVCALLFASAKEHSQMASVYPRVRAKSARSRKDHRVAMILPLLPAINVSTVIL
jgi:5-enolpyruvylshikimate-3-phosphate synthase